MVVGVIGIQFKRIVRLEKLENSFRDIKKKKEGISSNDIFIGELNDDRTNHEFAKSVNSTAPPPSLERKRGERRSRERELLRVIVIFLRRVPSSSSSFLFFFVVYRSGEIEILRRGKSSISLLG